MRNLLRFVLLVGAYVSTIVPAHSQQFTLSLDAGRELSVAHAVASDLGLDIERGYAEPSLTSTTATEWEAVAKGLRIGIDAAGILTGAYLIYYGFTQITSDEDMAAVVFLKAFVGGLAIAVGGVLFPLALLDLVRVLSGSG